MIKSHPAAEVFPLMSEPELKEMAKSITAFGLREKIGVILVDGGMEILDGRNRYTALQMIGVKDEVIEAEFTRTINLEDYRCTPEEYVLMANIERRNLTQGQRRALAGKLAVMYQEQQKDKPKEEQEDTLSKAAEAAGVSRRTAATAKKNVLIDAGKKPKEEPKKDSKPSGAGGAGIAARAIIKNVQTAQDVITKSGHNFEVEQLSEIANTCTVIARTARERIALIQKNLAERAAEAAAKAEFELATEADSPAVEPDLDDAA
jgi:carbamoylphosphate synthase small subunit